MTQEDVDLIYDYLHEHYRYQGGELIRKKIMRGRPAGKTLGIVIDCGNKKPHILATIYINGIKYTKPLSFFIFIFHKKYLPKYLSHEDNNPFNYSIENLTESSRKWSDYNKRPCKGYYKRNTKSGVSYRAAIRLANKQVHLGSYKTEKEAYDVYCKAKKLLKGKELNAEILLNKLNLNIKKVKKIYPKGVYKKLNRFVSWINVEKKRKYLGSFKTPQEAQEAYLKAKEELNNVKN